MSGEKAQNCLLLLQTWRLCEAAPSLMAPSMSFSVSPSLCFVLSRSGLLTLCLQVVTA